MGTSASRERRCCGAMTALCLQCAAESAAEGGHRKFTLVVHWKDCRSLTDADAHPQYLHYYSQCPVPNVVMEERTSWRCRRGQLMSQPRCSSSANSVRTTGGRDEEVPYRAAVLGRCDSSGVYRQGESIPKMRVSACILAYGFVANSSYHMENGRTLRGPLQQCLQAW